MLCKYCKVSMIDGISYRDRSSKENRKRFNECPVCRNRKYNNGFNFQEIFWKETERR